LFLFFVLVKGRGGYTQDQMVLKKEGLSSQKTIVARGRSLQDGEKERGTELCLFLLFSLLIAPRVSLPDVAGCVRANVSVFDGGDDEQRRGDNNEKLRKQNKSTQNKTTNESRFQQKTGLFLLRTHINAPIVQ
jgi:hypothetical protein